MTLLLTRFHRLALRLLPLLSFCLVLACGGVVLSGVALLRSGASPSPLLAIGLLLALWALLLLAFIRLFQRIPPPVLPKDTFLERLRARCKLALYHLLAFAVCGVGLVLVSLSAKLLSATAN